MGKTFNSALHKNIEILVRIRIISTQISTSSFHSYNTYYHKLKLLTSIELTPRAQCSMNTATAAKAIISPFMTLQDTRSIISNLANAIE